jgi:hypothetical protein
MKAALVTEEYYQKNLIFDKNLNESKFEGRTYRHIKLKEVFEDHKIDLSTQEINKIDESDIVIYLEMPKKLPKKEDIFKSFLIFFEPPSISPKNFNKNLHKYFNKIFTWDDDLVDNKLYFKINLSFNLSTNHSKNISFIDRKSFCMIAANKFSTHQNEAYTLRKQVINWFSKNNKDLDLYGYDWNKILFKRYPLTFFNRFNIFPQFVVKKLTSYSRLYKGKLNSKFDVLGEYKFCFCFENITGINGYISEKIFDCFFSNTIPIYIGAENITDYIPKNAFIDFRDFRSINDLYQYLESMDEDTYYLYHKNINSYLTSKKAELFDARYNAELIVNQILI